MRFDPARQAATATANHPLRSRPVRMTLLDVADPSYDLDPERWAPGNGGVVVHNGIRKSELRGIRL